MEITQNFKKRELVERLLTLKQITFQEALFLLEVELKYNNYDNLWYTAPYTPFTLPCSTGTSTLPSQTETGSYPDLTINYIDKLKTISNG